MNSISTLNAIKAVQAGLPQAAPTAAQTVMLYNADGTPAGKYPARQLIQDMATGGMGCGTCSTAATTAAKTVSISDFILLKNGIVSVRFVNGISVSGATLNVNSTGAKPILLNNIALPAQAIGENTTAILQYDGTSWQVIGVNAAVSQSDELLVDLGLPSGVRWATRNIDVTQANGFAASPFQYECSFVSWGNTEMFNPISTSAFSHDFGSSNDGVYASTPGAALSADAGLGYDAARINLGGTWRMPTTTEFKELFDNCTLIDADGNAVTASTSVAQTAADKRVSVNGVNGLYLQSNINGKRIFFACSGNGRGTSWRNRGSYGLYWSSSLGSATHGRLLDFGSGGVYPQYSYDRFYGFVVRPVQ